MNPECLQSKAYGWVYRPGTASVKIFCGRFNTLIPSEGLTANHHPKTRGRGSRNDRTASHILKACKNRLAAAVDMNA